MLKKIISGCQTLAGLGALDAAIKLEIKNGGWIPKGRFSETGVQPEAYNLREMGLGEPVGFMEKNIVDSDGTLILAQGEFQKEVGLLKKWADKHHRPLMHMDLACTPAFRAAQILATWIRQQRIETLHVDGPEEDRNPELYHRTLNIIESAYHLHLIDDSMGGLEKDLAKEAPEPPGTLEQAVNRLISDLPLRDKVSIANMTFDELGSLDPVLGDDIGFEFGLWNKNASLIESCRFASGQKQINPARASRIIIEALWEKLRKTHKLRVVRKDPAEELTNP